MNATMNIQEFDAFLKSDQKDNELLEVLRKLTAIEKPEDVRVMARGIGPLVTWQGWNL